LNRDTGLPALDQPIADYLTNRFGAANLPAPAATFRSVCDRSMERAADIHADRSLIAWTEAACMAGAVGVAEILIDSRPFVGYGPPISEDGLKRSVSVIGDELILFYLEARQRSQVGTLTAHEFAGLIISAVDAFGASFGMWQHRRHQRITSRGGRPLQPAEPLDALRVALWAPHIQAIPVDLDDLSELPSSNLPPITGDLGVLAGVEAIIVKTCVRDFAPRLEWLHGRRPR